MYYEHKRTMEGHNMKITITFGELSTRYDRESVCDVLGLDPYCLGRAPLDEEIVISEKDAVKIGILQLELLIKDLHKQGRCGEITQDCPWCYLECHTNGECDEEYPICAEMEEEE